MFKCSVYLIDIHPTTDDTFYRQRRYGLRGRNAIEVSKTSYLCQEGTNSDNGEGVAGGSWKGCGSSSQQATPLRLGEPTPPALQQPLEIAGGWLCHLFVVD